MPKQDYSSSIKVNASVREAFESIRNRVPEWWTNGRGDFEGKSQNLNDIFAVRFTKSGDMYKIKIIDMVPDKKNSLGGY